MGSELYEVNGVVVLERGEDGNWQAPEGLDGIASLLKVQRDTIDFLGHRLEEVRDESLEALSRVRSLRNEHGREDRLDEAAEILDDVYTRLEAYSS